MNTVKDRIEVLSFALSIAAPAATYAASITFVVAAILVNVPMAAFAAAISWPFSLIVFLCFVYIMLYAAGAITSRKIEYRINGKKQ